MPSEKQDKMVHLKVTANLLESKEGEQMPRGVAYAFSSGGRLLAQEALNEKGSATLTFAAAQEARSVRVVVGPELEEQEGLLRELQRRGTAERFSSAPCCACSSRPW